MAPETCALETDRRLAKLLACEPYWTARAMQEQGSRFYRALGTALEAADAQNRRLIYVAWLDTVWDFYGRGQLLRAAEESRGLAQGKLPAMAFPQTPTILAAFAHPDDEAFSVGGTLTHYARKGVRVVLACATRGEAGKITVPGMTVDDLGQQREQELKAACRALEIPDPVFLDYHDSGRYERTRHNDPLALMNVNPLDIETKLRALIAEVQPQIVLTFDPHGGYGHVDHLQMHRAASAAFFSTGHLPYGGPQRLYFTAMSSEAAQGLARMGRDLDPLIYGVSDSTVALSMHVQPYAENKKAALAAHGTQMGATSMLGQLSPEERQTMEKRMLGAESFSIGGTRTGLASFPLRGLFDGLKGFESLDD